MTRSRWEILDRAGSIVVAVAALVVAAAALTRKPAGGAATAVPELTAERVDRWDEIVSAATVLSRRGDLLVVQFGDFQCPFCRRFAQAVQSLPDSSKSRISEAIVNFPLSNHPFAMPAAIELECAATRGAAAAVHDRLFDAQDSLSRFGPRVVLEAGAIATGDQHLACLESPSAARRVEASVALGNALGVNMTPTVIIGGWRLSRPPNPVELDSIITAIASDP